MPQSIRTGARVGLALVRLINGVIGLFAPHVITGRFNAEADAPPVAHYALRMFGVRTILIAVDLLRRDGPTRAHAVKVAPIIHASDAVAALIAARSGLVARRTGVLVVVISCANTLMALAMQGGGAHDEEEDADGDYERDDR